MFMKKTEDDEHEKFAKIDFYLENRNFKMEKLIGGDIRYVLTEKLSCKDIWNLLKVTEYKSTKTKLQELLHPRCILEIKKRLKKVLGESYDEFVSVLSRTGAVISGSFIVQCLLNEDWNTDIDIFVPMIGNKIGKTDSNNPTTEVDDLLFQKFHMVDYQAGNRYGHDIDDEKIQWVRTFSKTQVYRRDVHGRFERIIDVQREKSGYNFQVVLVNIEKEKLCDFIIENFDFDIVKNTYTFFDNKLKILKLQEIFDKRTEFKVGTRLGSSVQRAIRYEKKGFSFYNKNMPYDRIFEIYTNGPKFSGGRPGIIIRHLKNTDKKKCTGCPNDCIIKFTHPEDEHYHVDGYHPSVEEIVIIPKKEIY